ncbi:MAG TPA: hypothetical protein GX513_10580, partial [Firmicutes bacterium]|nr:hypothetical protein [Bacillota bacterium]
AFRFEVYEIPPVISVRAVEEGKEFGYQFKEVGTPGDYHLLRGKLHDRIATALSRRHIVRDRSGISRWEMLTTRLEGRIDYDRDDQDICLVIDGEKIRKDNLGRVHGFRQNARGILVLPGVLRGLSTRNCSTQKAGAGGSTLVPTGTNATHRLGFSRAPRASGKSSAALRAAFTLD